MHPQTTWLNFSWKRWLAQLQFHRTSLPIFATRDFQSIHFWNQHWKFFSNLRSSWNHMKNSIFLIKGDCSNYSINCVRCKYRITACGSIADTLFHAPIAMLHHRGMIPNFEVLDKSGLKSMPLLFTGLDSFTRSITLMKNLWVTKLMMNFLLNVSTVSYLLTATAMCSN